MRPLPVDLARACAAQHGLFTRAQAYRAGVTREALRWRAGPGGTWQPVAGGVFASFTGPLSEEQRLQAALLYAGRPAMLCGGTTCRLLGLRAAPAEDRVQVLLPAQRHVVSVGFVVVHRTRNLPRARSVAGWRSAPAGFAVAQHARHSPHLESVQALVAEALQRRLVSYDQLAAELRSGVRHGHLSDVLAEVAPGARSVAELALHALIRSSGLPEPAVNEPLLLPGGRQAVPDFRWGSLILELDSREWHIDPRRWQADLARADVLTALGYRVLHVTPADVTKRPEWVVRLIRTALRNQVAVA